MLSQDYPRMMFHRTLEPVIVQSQSEEQALGPEWSRTIPVPEPVPESPSPEPDEPEEDEPKEERKPVRPPLGRPARHAAKPAVRWRH